MLKSNVNNKLVLITVAFSLPMELNNRNLTLLSKPVIITTKVFPYPLGSVGFAILIGLLLGDGSLSSASPFTKARYEHCCSTWLYLTNLTKIELPLMFATGGYVRVGKTRLNDYRRISLSYTELRWLYEQFYNSHPPMLDKPVKTLPQPLLWYYFEAISLSHWFMGDGTWSMAHNCIRLSTHSFTLPECEFLCTLLWVKLGIIAKVNMTSGWPLIRVSTKSTSRFFSLILPYLHPDFYYKVPSIYLPEWTVVYVDPRPVYQHSMLNLNTCGHGLATLNNNYQLIITQQPGVLWLGLKPML